MNSRPGSASYVATYPPATFGLAGFLRPMLRTINTSHSTPLAATLALTSIAAGEPFMQSLRPNDSATRTLPQTAEFYHPSASRQCQRHRLAVCSLSRLQAGDFGVSHRPQPYVRTGSGFAELARVSSRRAPETRLAAILNRTVVRALILKQMP